MDCKEIVFSRHAIERMFERGVSPVQVRVALAKGEIITEFPEDKPLPSRLILHVDSGQPLHVVVAFDQGDQRCIIVTAYQPDPDIWEADFKTRRPR